MPQLPHSLQQKIAQDPQAMQNVIVRVNGDLDAVQEMLEANGFQIRRKFTLIKGFAATASGSQVQYIARQTWIISVEEDQQVHIM